MKRESSEKPETFEVYKHEILKLCGDIHVHFMNMTDQDLQDVEITLSRTKETYPFWYLINDPLADTIHHIGQMVTWRRISGNPVPRISPFTGNSY